MKPENNVFGGTMMSKDVKKDRIGTEIDEIAKT